MTAAEKMLLLAKYRITNTVTKKFAGDKKQWRFFKDQWMRAYAEMKSMGFTQMTVFQQLLNVVESTPRVLIEDFPLDENQSYKTAIAILIEEYGREQLHLEYTLDDIIKLPKCASNVRDMKARRAAIMSFLARIQRLGADSEVLIFAIMMRWIGPALSKEHIQSWERYKVKNASSTELLGFTGQWLALTDTMQISTDLYDGELKCKGGSSDKKTDKPKANAKKDSTFAATESGGKKKGSKGSKGAEGGLGAAFEAFVTEQHSMAVAAGQPKQGKGRGRGSSKGGGQGRPGGDRLSKKPVFNKDAKGYRVDDKEIKAKCTICMTDSGNQQFKHIWPRYCPLLHKDANLETTWLKRQVNVNKGCINCYAEGHKVDNCPYGMLTCPVSGCEEKHGGLFHKYGVSKSHHVSLYDVMTAHDQNHEVTNYPEGERDSAPPRKRGGKKK